MKIQPYSSFWKRIHNLARNKGFPLRVMFELTYRCNFRCGHCYLPENYRKRKKELSTKDVFLILDQLKDIGCFYLGFTGGEPFLRKDIMQILWYAKDKGFEVIVYTNGSLIDKEMASELSYLSPNKIDITIPAMSEDIFDSISGVSGSRNRVFRAIEFLHDKKVNLGFKTCVLKKNKHEIKAIQDFAASLSAFHRLDDMLFPRLDGSKEPYKYKEKPIQRLFSPKAFKNKKAPFADNCGTADPVSGPLALFKCGVGISQGAITPLGELKMCLMIAHPKYKILNTSLNDAWGKLRETARGIKYGNDYRCGNCGLRAYCKSCPARGWLYNKSFTSCDAESKRKAEFNKQSLSRLV